MKNYGNFRFWTPTLRTGNLISYCYRKSSSRRLWIHHSGQDLVAIRPASASQDGKAREVWRMEETMPHIPTPLISGDRLYLWADNGVITCLRPSSGEKVWKARVENVKDTFFGSPVLAGNTVFCVSAYGQVVAISDTDEFKQLGVTNLGELCRSTPALANGDLYLRTAKRLLCIKGT